MYALWFGLPAAAVQCLHLCAALINDVLAVRMLHVSNLLAAKAVLHAA